MSALATICDEMNQYINTKGKLPSSRKRKGFLHDWHDLDNEFWLMVFSDAIRVNDHTRYRMPQWLEDNIIQLTGHIARYGKKHPNILNPYREDEDRLLHEERYFSTGKSVKSVLWHTLMELRERLYNPAMGIDLPNDDHSIGKMKRETFKELFE